MTSSPADNSLITSPSALRIVAGFGLTAGCGSCGQRQNQRAVRQRVRADRRERKHLRRGRDQRAAGRQRIGGRAGRRTDDQAVAAIAGQRFAIDIHVQLDEAGDHAAADDDVVERGLADEPTVAASRGLDERAGFEAEIPRSRRRFKRLRQSSDGTAVRKPRPPMLMPEHGRARAGDFAGHAQHSAVAAKHEQQVHLRARLAASGQVTILSRAACAVAGSAAHFAARGANQPGGVRTTCCKLTFSEFPISPTRLILSARIFQSTPKTLCFPPGRAAGIRSPPPPQQPWLGRHELVATRAARAHGSRGRESRPRL